MLNIDMVEKYTCCICGKTESSHWYNHFDKEENFVGKKCNICKKMLDRYGTIDPVEIQNIKYEYHRNIRLKIKCCVCNSDKSYVKGLDQFGYDIYDWRSCKCGKGNCTIYICKKCYCKEYVKADDSQNNIRKCLADSRTGNIDRFTNHGKDLIGQWIAARVLGLKDLNLENNNFREPIDLSMHIIYGNIDVKIRTYDHVSRKWGFSPLKSGSRTTYDFDHLLAICIDKYEPWKHVERVYIIPRDAIGHVIGFAIVISEIRTCKWDQFRISEVAYDKIYNSVNIPRFFSPWDLWKGKYDI